MTMWDRVTGNDMDREMKEFEARVKELPEDYRQVWEEIKDSLWLHSDFTGRNLMGTMEGIVGLLEESAFEGESAKEAIGEDVKGFCAALMGEDHSNTYRDRWRKQLNNSIKNKLGK